MKIFCKGRKTERMIYLDAAATSYQKPPAVYKALADASGRSANAGRGGHKASALAARLLYEAREAAAALFQLKNPERLIFCPNATFALNAAIKGALKKGDHALVGPMEHNSVLRPVARLARDGLISYDIAPANRKGEVLPQAFEAMLRPNTRLVAVSHASNVCGNVADVEKIGKIVRAKGALFLIDAAQSAGVLPLTAAMADMIAFAGHKGLMGPQGTGGLLLRENLTLSTLIEGGTGTDSARLSAPETLPDRFEAGTQNMPGAAALGAGIRFILKEGLEAIRAHEAELTERLYAGLANMPRATLYGTENLKKRVGVVAFNIKGMDSTEVCAALDEDYDIAARCGLHCAPLAHKTLGTFELGGAARFSLGYFNTKKEIDKALDAVWKISKSR
jgi:cysteine desulfurase family protein